LTPRKAIVDRLDIGDSIKIHLNLCFWAVQGMAAELNYRAMVMSQSRKVGRNVSLLSGRNNNAFFPKSYW